MPVVAMLADAATTPGADAAEGAGFDVLVGALPNAMTMVNAVWDFAMKNPLLILAVVGAAVGIGAAIFGTIKGAVSH